MAKRTYTYDGSEWVGLTSTTADLSNYEQKNNVGLVSIAPSSVSVGSGTYSMNTKGKVTFTNASRVSLNGCFSSQYKFYKIIMSAKHATTAVWVWTRLRKNGTDATGASYWTTGIEINTTSALIKQSDSGSVAGFRTFICGSFMNGLSEITLLNPNSDIPSFTSTGQGYNNGVNYVANMGGFYDSPGSGINTFDGITIYPNTGSFASGTIKVFGYNEEV
jgi:hypothetical protein